MPDHIAIQIKNAEAYRIERASILNTISELKSKLTDIARAFDKPNWPHIYMLCVCVEPFSVYKYDNKYDEEFQEIKIGEKVIFRYNYLGGFFEGNINFFNYSDYANNLQVVKYSNSVDDLV